MTAKYFSGANLRFWFYESEASVRCPYAEGPPAWMADDLAASEFNAREHGDPALGLDLTKVFKLAHGRSASLADPEDKQRCRSCGSFLEKIGYYAWAEEPWPSERELERETKRLGGWARRALADEEAEACRMAVSSALSTRAINLRLGNTLRRVPGSGRHFPKKNDAIAWAREQAQIDRAAARDEARS